MAELDQLLAPSHKSTFFSQQLVHEKEFFDADRGKEWGSYTGAFCTMNLNNDICFIHATNVCIITTNNGYISIKQVAPATNTVQTVTILPNPKYM